MYGTYAAPYIVTDLQTAGVGMGAGVGVGFVPLNIPSYIILTKGVLNEKCSFFYIHKSEMKKRKTNPF